MAIEKGDHFLEGKTPLRRAFIIPAMAAAGQGHQLKHFFIGNQLFNNGHGIGIEHHIVF